jgi:Vitamin K-dependent gamma-carboxylase
MSLGRRLDDILFGPESAARMWFVHVGLAALIGLRVALGPYRQLAGQPAGLFRPVPFLAWLDQMPPMEVILVVQIVGAVAALLAMLGRRRRLMFAVAWVAFLVLAGLRASRGKILHNDVLLLLASTPFLLAPSVDTPASRTPSRRFGWPVRSALALVAASYFFSGYWKLRTSGLEWVTGDNMRWILVQVPDTSWHLDGFASTVAGSPWLWRPTAAAILALEITFPVVLLWPRVRPLFAVGAVVFHALTRFMLGLDYWSYAAVAVLLLIDWPRVWDRIRLRSRRHRLRGIREADGERVLPSMVSLLECPPRRNRS